MDGNIMLLKRLFPSLMVSTNNDNVHLTFDDGPHPITTPIILDILNKFSIHATFFPLGQNVEKYPDLVKEIIKEGHQVGNHSFSHTNFFLTHNNECKMDILRTQEMIKSITGIQPNHFRPPYGYFNLSTLEVIKELELKCVLWSLDSKDYKSTSTKIIRRVIKRIDNGSIILFHDNDYTMSKLNDYLPYIIKRLLQEGFSFNTLPL